MPRFRGYGARIPAIRRPEGQELPGKFCRRAVPAGPRRWSTAGPPAITHAGIGIMVARINTIAFLGVETLAVDVQVHMAGGLPAFTIVGSY